MNFFDLQGNLLEVKDAEHSRESLEIAPIPTNLNKMIELSRVLSNETYFLRVDFYEVKDRFMSENLPSLKMEDFVILSQRNIIVFGEIG